MNKVQFITAASVCCMLGATLLAADQEEPKTATKEKGAVRRLSYRPTESAFRNQYVGKRKAVAMADAATVAKLIGEDSANKLSTLVDFSNEQIVVVCWTMVGPPNGVLKHEIKDKEEPQKLVFYVQAPSSRIRGMRYGMAVTLFAAPKGLDVSYDPIERPSPGQAKATTPSGEKPLVRGRGRVPRTLRTAVEIPSPTPAESE